MNFDRNGAPGQLWPAREGWIQRQSAEAVALDLKSPVEARVQILQRDCRRQVHQCSIVEMTPQFGEGLVGHFDRRSRHLFRVSDRGAFGGGEERILVVGVQSGEHFLGHAEPHHDRGTDVDTETATDQLSGAEARQILGPRRDRV